MNIEKTDKFMIPKNCFESNKVKMWLKDNGHIIYNEDKIIRIRDNSIMNHRDGWSVLDHLINEFSGLYNRREKMNINKVTELIMLGDANACTYIVSVKVKKLKCGRYSKTDNEVFPFYRIDGVVDCVKLHECERYSSISIFVSKKMFDLVTALNELQKGTLYIEFVVRVIRGEESDYDLLLHRWE